MKSIVDRAAAGVPAVGAVLSVASLIIFFNGGLDVGMSNHVGLLPVVRRILDANYLAGDFGIHLRLYHHRTFAELIAGLARIIGEERALIVLSVVCTLALSTALYCLCRALRLPLSAYLFVGLFLALSVGWTGRGLEENTFVSDREITPMTVSNAFVLFAVAALITRRYRATAFCVGLTFLFHLQVGIILALMVAPFYAIRLKQHGAKELLSFIACFMVPASIALWHIWQMTQRGVFSSNFSRYYIDFRMPSHFELGGAPHAVWTAIHLLVQVAAYSWLRQARRPEGRGVGVLLTLSLLLTAFSLAHFAEYYLMTTTSILKFQFIRLSPAITVFGTVTFITALNAWRASEQGSGRRRRAVLVYASLTIAAGAQLIDQLAFEKLNYSLRVHRYVDQKSSWVAVCRWIDKNGPPGSVYLTPPGREGFAYLANRSPVVEFKINPDGGQFLSEWFDRLKNMGGGVLPNDRGFKNGLLLDQAFASLRPKQLVALGKTYDAWYAVLPKASTAHFETIYRNAGYRVVKLPSSR